MKAQRVLAAAARDAVPHRLVLLIDDHPLYRAGLRGALAAFGPGLRIDEAATTLAALDAMLDCTSYDLILYDWHLPGGGGCRGLSAICQVAPTVPVVVISADEDEAIGVAALSIGAADFLPKSLDAERMRDALAPYLSRGACARAVPVPLPAALTPRQHQVLQLMARGAPNKRIAHRLGIAETTVRAHVSDILQLMQVHNRTEAVVMAQRNGLLGSGYAG